MKRIILLFLCLFGNLTGTLGHADNHSVTAVLALQLFDIIGC